MLGSMMFDQNIVDAGHHVPEPVGGMDRIPAAFHRAIKSPILLGAEVNRIRQGTEKAEMLPISILGRGQARQRIRRLRGLHDSTTRARRDRYRLQPTG